MKPIEEIVFGFSDAENYRRRENKQLFDRIFLRTAAIDEIKKRSTFFLVGEKGTGKTAYAVHFAADIRDGHRSIHKYIRETDYQKFVALRKDKHLGLSEYTDIWKVIILLLMADAVYQSAGRAEFLLQYPKFKAVRSAIDEYYESGFSPEIIVALQFVEHSDEALAILAKYGPVSGKIESSRERKQLKIRKHFKSIYYLSKKHLKRLFLR